MTSREAVFASTMKLIENDPMLRQILVSWCNMLNNWPGSKLHGLMHIHDIERTVVSAMLQLSRTDLKVAAETLSTLAVVLARPVEFSYIVDGITHDMVLNSKMVGTA